MSWELKAARAAFPAFTEEWDRLNRALYNVHPLFDSRFVGPLLEYFGDGSEQLCIHRTAGTIDGALILNPLGLGRWALFMPAQAQASPLLLRDARLLETLLPALPGFALSIDLLAIDPDYAPHWAGLRLPRTVTPHTLTMAVALDGDFDDYWQGRPRQLVKNMRRYQRRAEETSDGPSLITITAADQIAAAVARYGQLETSGWKGQAGTAVSMDNVQGKFYQATLCAFAASGLARILELHIDGKLAAARLMICNPQMWVILKTTYDETLAALAPGRQLLKLALRQAFVERKTGTVEFYTDASHDQAEWATSLRLIHHHQIYRGDVSATLLGLAKNIRSSLNGAATAQRKKDKPDPISIHSHPGIVALPAAALQLFEDAARSNVEFSADWFDNLQQTVFPDDPGVRYLVAESTGHPAAILPLRLIRKGGKRAIESFSNYYTSLYSPLLAAHGTADDLARLLKQAQTDQGGSHAMRFLPMDPDSPAYEGLLTALRSIGWVPFRFFCFGNWYLGVEESWPKYLKKREGKLRSTLKRMGKKFTAEGGTLEILSEPQQTETAIQAFNDVYAHSWKKPEPYPRFIPGLIRWLANKGQLRLGIARIDGSPVAAQLWIVANGKASIFKLAYNETSAAYSPGTLLTAHLMQHVMERDGVAEIDYLIGDDEHKKSWMSERRERWGIVAYNPGTLIGLALLIKEVIGRTLRKTIQMTRPQPAISSQAVCWEIVPIHRFSEYAAQWDALQRSCANLPFLDSAFLLPLLAEFGTGRELLALASRGGSPVAAAIVTRKRAGVWQTFQPSQLPLGAWVSDAQANLATLGKSLIHSLPGINLSLSLTQIDPQYQPRPDDGPCLRTMDYINTAWVDIDQAFDTYWEARGKNLKTNMRKQRVKLETENVAPCLECMTTPAAVAQAIADYGALESAGWKGKDGTAIHPDNAQGRFYQKMLENFCAQGRGRIYCYRFNDKVVAMDLCIETGDKIVILKTAYDESYKAVSPSTLMRQDEFRELFNEGRLKRIEFYGKVMEWHTRWTDHSRTLYHATIYRQALLHTLHAYSKNVRTEAASD